MLGVVDLHRSSISVVMATATPIKAVKYLKAFLLPSLPRGPVRTRGLSLLALTGNEKA